MNLVKIVAIPLLLCVILVGCPSPSGSSSNSATPTSKPASYVDLNVDGTAYHWNSSSGFFSRTGTTGIAAIFAANPSSAFVNSLFIYLPSKTAGTYTSTTTAGSQSTNLSFYDASGLLFFSNINAGGTWNGTSCSITVDSWASTSVTGHFSGTVAHYVSSSNTFLTNKTVSGTFVSYDADVVKSLVSSKSIDSQNALQENIDRIRAQSALPR